MTVNRGFPIQEDLLYKMAKLEIPPPSSGLEQICAQHVAKIRKIANDRIRRACHKPVKMVPDFEHTVTIICGHYVG